jgi:4-hydroxybenzoate polyprenyltransferase
MFAIQASIGALNDLVDAPFDGGRRPPKPIAEGLVSGPAARVVVGTTATAGFTLAALSGWATLLVAVAGAACGYAYDLRLSRTAWAWVPLAVALPLVPVFAWLGATGGLPAALLILVPIAVLAGAGLAVGNALADYEVDRLAGAPSVAVRLGRQQAWRLHALTLGLAAGLAVASRAAGAPPVALGLLVGGVALLGLGAAMLGLSGHATTRRPARLGWQLEGIGVAAMGIGWVVALGSAGPA